MNIQEFLTQEDSIKWTNSILEATGSKIFPTYNEILEQETAAQLVASGFSIGELINTARSNEDLFIKQTTALIKKSQGASIEQAYSFKDKSLPDEWKTATNLGLAKDFLIPHLIIFNYLINNPHNLENYLKSTKNPSPKKLAKQLIDGFSLITKDAGIE